MERRGDTLVSRDVCARDLPDLWFQAIHDILEPEYGARNFLIDRGSYDGDGNKEDAQTRLQYDFFKGHVLNPGHGAGTPAILPEVPTGITPPVLFGYIYGDEAHPRPYLEKVMTPAKEPGESYTYGERLTKAPLSEGLLAQMLQGKDSIIDARKVDGKIIFEEGGGLYLNQVEAIIDTYKRFGPMNNQMVLQVAQPSDIMLKDPPCLRSIGTRILEDKFHFIPIEFRSWDLWGGLPANLAALQALKEYMAYSIGVEDGEMIVTSQGLHLYGYGEDVVRDIFFQNYLEALKVNGVLDRKPRSLEIGD